MSFPPGLSTRNDFSSVLTIWITTLQRVKSAVWQIEGDVFEFHVCQPLPRVAGREMPMLASLSLVLDLCASSGAGCTAGSAGQSVELADLSVEGARGHDPA